MRLSLRRRLGTRTSIQRQDVNLRVKSQWVPQNPLLIHSQVRIPPSTPLVNEVPPGMRRQVDTRT